MYITEIIAGKKGKVTVMTDAGFSFPAYYKELKTYQIKEGETLTDQAWDRFCTEVLNKRAAKRIMYLLQIMDRTEFQLRQKLREWGYPQEVSDAAIDYVKSFHYVDDLRYAESYIRYHQEEKSRMQLKMTLMQRGISSQLIDQALDSEYQADENGLIYKLLEKKKYDPQTAAVEERRKVYAFLMRKGFSDSAVRHCMESRQS